jgi:hypothetical protein
MNKFISYTAIPLYIVMVITNLIFTYINNQNWTTSIITAIVPLLILLYIKSRKKKTNDIFSASSESFEEFFSFYNKNYKSVKELEQLCYYVFYTNIGWNKLINIFSW